MLISCSKKNRVKDALRNDKKESTLHLNLHSVFKDFKASKLTFRACGLLNRVRSQLGTRKKGQLKRIWIITVKAQKQNKLNTNYISRTLSNLLFSPSTTCWLIWSIYIRRPCKGKKKKSENLLTFKLKDCFFHSLSLSLFILLKCSQSVSCLYECSKKT